MVKLVEIVGIPLNFDEEVAKLYYDEQQVQWRGGKSTVKLTDLTPALLNKALKYPENVYAKHIGMQLACHDCWPADYYLDLLTIPVGLLGIEYIKTHVFYTEDCPGMVASVVQVYVGKLVVIMQRNRPKHDRYDIETYVDEVVKIELKSGEKLAIPTGYMYMFVNTGSVPVVVARLIKKEHQIDYGIIRRENGLAYYLIAKNARLEMVPNPRYRNMVPVKKIKLADLNERTGYVPQEDKCLYEEVYADVARFANVWA